MDGNGIKARLWCRSVKGKSYLAYCTLCFKEFSISNSGFNQIKQHCQSAKHKQISDVWFGAENQKQTLITGQKHQEASASASAETTLDIKSDILDKAKKKSEGLCLAPSFSDQVTESELLWCYKVAASDFSFRSCDHIRKLFERMFKCPIAEHYQEQRHHT